MDGLQLGWWMQFSNPNHQWQSQLANRLDTHWLRNVTPKPMENQKDGRFPVFFVEYLKLSNCGGGFCFNSASVEQAKYSSGLQYWAGAFKSISNSAKAMAPSWQDHTITPRDGSDIFNDVKSHILSIPNSCKTSELFGVKPNSQSSWGRRFPPTQIAGDASPVLFPCCAWNCARNCPTVKGRGRAALPSDVMVPGWWPLFS